MAGVWSINKSCTLHFSALFTCHTVFICITPGNWKGHKNMHQQCARMWQLKFSLHTCEFWARLVFLGEMHQWTRERWENHIRRVMSTRTWARLSDNINSFEKKKSSLVISFLCVLSSKWQVHFLSLLGHVALAAPCAAGSCCHHIWVFHWGILWVLVLSPQFPVQFCHNQHFDADLRTNSATCINYNGFPFSKLKPEMLLLISINVHLLNAPKTVGHQQHASEGWLILFFLRVFIYLNGRVTQNEEKTKRNLPSAT